MSKITSVIRIAITSILLILAGCAAFQSQRPVVISLTQALKAPPEQLAIGYLAASFMLDAARVAAKQPNLTIQTGIDGRIQTINQSNADEFVAAFEERLKTYREAIEQRGFRKIGSTYRAETTPSCEVIQSMWAGGIRAGVLKDLKITQDGFRVQLVHQLQYNGESHDVKISGVVVESALAFSDPMNSDFWFLGQIETEKITVKPNVGVIIATWPKWVNAPSRTDLSGCLVTLIPTQK